MCLQFQESIIQSIYHQDPYHCKILNIKSQQINPPMNPSQKKKKFYEIYLNAKGKKQKKLFQEARKYYLSLQKSFSIKDVDYTDFVSMIGQLGDVEKQLKLFTQGKQTYLRGINFLNSANSFKKNVSEYDIQKQKFHLYSNLGLTQCAEAQSIIEKIQNYDLLKKLIDSSLSNFRFCEKIVVRMIIEQLSGDEKNQKFWWKNQFIGLIINMSNALQIQGFEFKDKITLQTIIKLIEKAQKFYNLSKRKTRKHLENNLSKCFYSKALAFKFLGLRKQSQQYFKKDYNFCQQNNLAQDLNKTRLQMLKFYLQNYRFKEARGYTASDDQKIQLSNSQKQNKQLMNKIFEIQRKAQRGFQITLQEIDYVLYQLNETLNLLQKALEFNKKIRNSKQFKQNKSIRYKIIYFAAEAYTKLQNYGEALRELKQATMLIQNDLQQEIWCLSLRASILQKTQNDRKKVELLFKECLQKSKQSGKQNLIQNSEKELKQFYLKEKRRNRYFNFETPQSKQLFEYMTRKKKQKQMKQQQLMEDFSDQMQQNSKQPEIQSFNSQPLKKLTKTLNPYSLYIQNCKQLCIQPLERFKQILLTEKQIKLKDFIYFPVQHIEALLKSVPSIQSLDLSNLVVTNEFLKSIKKSQFIYCVKKLKINFVNASICEKLVKKSFYQQFYEILRLAPFLENLSISNCYENQEIQKIIHSVDIQSIRLLTVLKLKQCQLEDSFFTFLNIQQSLPQLKRLSLSRNNLEGSTLNSLTKLKNLEKISLSWNPLRKVNINRQFESLKQVSVNGLSDCINISEASKFIPLLLRCSIINLKQCERICLQVVSNLVDYTIENQSYLSNLKQLNLFSSILDFRKASQVIRRLANISENVKRIDLRNCKILKIQSQNYLLQQLNKLNRQRNKSILSQHLQSSEHCQFQNPENQQFIKMTNLLFFEEQFQLKSSKFRIF